MPINAEESTHVLVHRILVVQIILIAAAGTLVIIAINVDLGFFWFAFLAGILGSSIALLRRVQNGDGSLAQATLRTWSTTLMPFMYGGIMAAVTYFLFVSQVLSGQEGNGLLATNLFPDFGSSTTDRDRLAVGDWLDLRPKDIHDAGKLIVWCFLAGYSESFVSGILQRLERNTARQ